LPASPPEISSLSIPGTPSNGFNVIRAYLDIIRHLAPGVFIHIHSRMASRSNPSIPQNNLNT
jgi:hypothetical protein